MDTLITKYLKDTQTVLLTLLLVFSLLVRLYMLNSPNAYVFDEVYHAFTAKEYLKGNTEAWDPFAKPPEGVAYEWLHPPIGKEIMSFSMMIFGSTSPWAWRLPGVLFGTFAIWLVYKICVLLFENPTLGLVSAFIYSMDGLSFVQSRTGMNDIYVTCFILISLWFFIKNRFIFSAIFLGVAIATKWPGIFLFGVYAVLLTSKLKFKPFLFFVIIPPLIYLFSYTPYFLLGYDYKNLIELHKQIWWYQTTLRATHDYASPWWSWPFNLYPVWYYVSYANDRIANIFASGNPIVFLGGFISILFLIFDFFKKRLRSLLVIILCYFAFWLPWAFSPRIMFLYHYTPSLPFLSIAFGYQLYQIKKTPGANLVFYGLLTLVFVSFMLLYPFLTGVFLPKEAVRIFFYTNATKNPF